MGVTQKSENPSASPEAAAHRSASATCTQLLDMGHPEDDPIIAKYSEGILGGILTPIATLYAHTPGFPTAWRRAQCTSTADSARTVGFDGSGP